MDLGCHSNIPFPSPFSVVLSFIPSWFDICFPQHIRQFADIYRTYDISVALLPCPLPYPINKPTRYSVFLSELELVLPPRRVGCANGLPSGGKPGREQAATEIDVLGDRLLGDSACRATPFYCLYLRKHNPFLLNTRLSSSYY